MKFEEWLSQQDGVIEVDCGCVTTEAFYHWMRVAYDGGAAASFWGGLFEEIKGRSSPHPGDFTPPTDMSVEDIIDALNNMQQEKRIADAVELLKKAAPAMLADNSGHDGPLAGRLKSPVIPDSARDALEKALAAMEFMGDTLNNLDAVCTEDVEFVAPAFDAVRSVLAAAPQPQNAPQNIPEIIPGWIPVSERMPEMGEKQRYVLAADFKNNYWPNIPNTQVGVYGDWFDDGNPTWDDGDGEDLHLKEVTHWMPLPAGPQEVK